MGNRPFPRLLKAISIAEESEAEGGDQAQEEKRDHSGPLHAHRTVVALELEPLPLMLELPDKTDVERARGEPLQEGLEVVVVAAAVRCFAHPSFGRAMRHRISV